MADLAKFLHDTLFEGCIRFDAQPSEANEAGALSELRRAYDVHAAALAGPPLPLDSAIALAAGRLLMRAAWLLLNPDKPMVSLQMPGPPRTPEQHASADLVLRLLPTVHRRAKALSKDDALPLALEQVLRAWPLSGVLADIHDPPLTPIDFGQHAGLHLLYAERLAAHSRPGWIPARPALDYVELVWQQLGKNTAILKSHLEMDGARP